MRPTENTAKAEALIAGLPPAPAYAVAFSGGLDSTVLLDLLAGRVQPLRALHVDHGLHPDSGDWARHCRQVCAALGIDCRVLPLTGPAPAGNREAWAREQRYRALRAALAPGECLLTAHHRQDQAETLLLNLLRGSGADGLAAMPATRPLGPDNWLHRPLLELPPERLRAYAQERDLRWLEDPANRDQAFDRNFLRHRLLPLLEARFPGAVARIARSAALLGAGRDAEEVDDWLAAVTVGARADAGALARLPPARRHWLLRRWLQRLGLPSPRQRMLAEIHRQLLAGPPGREPVIRWPGAELRRHRGWIHAMAPLAAPDAALCWDIAGDGEGDWPGGGRLHWQLQAPATVRYPAGGERLRIGGRERALRELARVAGLPPWQRRRLPLLWRDGRLLAAGGLWRADELGQGEAFFVRE